MPVSSPPNCMIKTSRAIIATSIILFVSLYISVNLIGLMGIFIVFGLSLLLTVWIMDFYGDRIFTYKEYMPSEKKSNEMKDKKIPESILKDLHKLGISK